jgi:hypothetical protein
VRSTRRCDPAIGIVLTVALLTFAACASDTDPPGPSTTPAAEPTSEPSSTSTADPIDASPTWPGAVRADAAMPTLSRRHARGWTDPRDSTLDGIDIGLVSGEGREYNGIAVIDGRNIPSFSAGAWSLELVARPPRIETLGATHRIIEYGLVIDTDGNRVPDCQIGINNDARQHGNYPVFRVWVTNLRTGSSDEQVGGPYGYPVEFSHPSEAGSGNSMAFGFLGDQPARCDTFGPSATFYAYSSLIEDGEVTVWDFAPDAAWLPMGCSKACREIGEP